MGPGGIEAVGEAVTGGLAARALEPAAGEHRGDGQGGVCLNCGTALIGPHCHQCGQPAHVHRSVAAWWHDLAHGVLHLDGKIWRTLPLLAWRPGELTRRYIHGERAKFVSPLALFLFSVFLMFAIFSAFGGGGISADPARVKQGLAEEVRTDEAAIARMAAERAAAAAAHKPTAGIDRRLKDAGEQLALLRTMKERGLVQGSAVRVADDVPAWLRKPIEKAGRNPSLMLYKLQSNAYKFSWALIPISVPFLWLLFLHRGRYRREYKAYDHLIFVTYSIAFISLALVMLVLMRAVGMPAAMLGLLTFAVPPLHIYRQLRGAYRVTRIGAAWRTAALLLFATWALALFLLLLVALGVLG
ncbi:MAG: hypothetical protein QOK17_329 [Sphingomonadales bacterium]|jgi:hypothetical protein|nr:hypothetical protein [Sphingomonadales bacterium]